MARESHAGSGDIVSQYIKGNASTTILKGGGTNFTDRGYSYRRMQKTEEDLEMDKRVTKRVVENNVVEEKLSTEFKMSGRNNVYSKGEILQIPSTDPKWLLKFDFAKLFCVGGDICILK